MTSPPDPSTRLNPSRQEKISTLGTVSSFTFDRWMPLNHNCDRKILNKIIYHFVENLWLSVEQYSTCIKMKCNIDWCCTKTCSVSILKMSHLMMDALSKPDCWLDGGGSVIGKSFSNSCRSFLMQLYLKELVLQNSHFLAFAECVLHLSTFLSSPHCY